MSLKSFIATFLGLCVVLAVSADDNDNGPGHHKPITHIGGTGVGSGCVEYPSKESVAAQRKVPTSVAATPQAKKIEEWYVSAQNKLLSMSTVANGLRNDGKYSDALAELERDLRDISVWDGTSSEGSPRLQSMVERSLDQVIRAKLNASKEDFDTRNDRFSMIMDGIDFTASGCLYCIESLLENEDAKKAEEP